MRRNKLQLDYIFIHSRHEAAIIISVIVMFYIMLNFLISAHICPSTFRDIQAVIKTLK